ncbi:Glyoxalase/Bleomycin resistance protein/Dihydroxybiphenyl dioxygenase [Acaromyces ingoldii]|uniref:Glyoxalase/Bleomycin resistance protein/Dihydroxybiphenyl dioxygenase n=1 Tax=Acaromyces ingoldii TaxID=215250 RepID=A0A316YI31_9BASI|nr:Glyoxalase/Bleomycin resistance protein/Dihydroxybiphenyl dioxygenase [Acaromyces ingoldii]PWN88832.1 Glyoxalase/Bleomycin resistance protein/Dihydroxybiphenyl dioxygenase [Acaromyces ingoldii]
MSMSYETLKPGERYASGDGPVEDENLQSALLNHVCLNISEPKRSLDFYKSVLGFSSLFSWNIGPQTVFFLGHRKAATSQEDFLKGMQGSAGLLELLWMHDAQPDAGAVTPPPRVGFFHIGITVDSVSDIARKAREFGSTIIKEPGPVQDETKLGLPAGTPSVDASCHKILSKVAYIADPDGNWIELVPRNIHA